MNIYLVARPSVTWDQYGTMVVCAESPRAARRIYPTEYAVWDDGTRSFVYRTTGAPVTNTAWTNKIRGLRVTLVGTALDGVEAGTVLCASYHAG